MKQHVLKLENAYFDAVASGEKNFEVRRDDRGFQKGDWLLLCRYGKENYSPLAKFGFMNEHGKVVSSSYSTVGVNRLERRIKYILTGGQFGIEPGYVVLALEEEEPQ